VTTLLDNCTESSASKSQMHTQATRSPTSSDVIQHIDIWRQSTSYDTNTIHMLRRDDRGCTKFDLGLYGLRTEHTHYWSDLWLERSEQTA